MERSETFHESKLGQRPLRELGLTIEGSELEGILQDFLEELHAVGIVHLKPRFYLSTEWGVPFQTIAIAIPFYLVHPELAELHADRTGLVEGTDRGDILRYLRHEMGHVVNYAYQLYDRKDWVELFGAITQPYLEAYRPHPWSTSFVHHLPGWYAQKHPDEDWAETFAVWMTPGRHWRRDYAMWPTALAKLEGCAAMMEEVSSLRPSVVADDLDEDVSEIDYSIDHYYQHSAEAAREFPLGLEGALRVIFPGNAAHADHAAASRLIEKHRLRIARSVFTWTGHFPEDTRALLQHLASHANVLELGYLRSQEEDVLMDLTVLIASLAMNHVKDGSYFPSSS